MPVHQLDTMEVRPGANFNKIIDSGVNFALSYIKRKHGNERNPAEVTAYETKEHLAFHGGNGEADKNHSEGVIRRSTLILETIRSADPTLISEREIQLGKLVASFHDLIQRSEPVVAGDSQPGTITERRKRYAGDLIKLDERGVPVKGIERQSADALEGWMLRQNKLYKKEVFSKAEIQRCKQAIMVTIPGFDPPPPNGSGKGIIQPGLDQTNDLLALATAWGDLGASLIEGPQDNLEDSKRVLREDNVGITREVYTYMKAGKAYDQMSLEDQQFIKGKIVGGLVFFQRLLVDGQIAQLHHYIQKIPSQEA